MNKKTAKKNGKTQSNSKGVLGAIEQLAIMTKRGFDNTIGRSEFNEFREEFNAFRKDTVPVLFSLDSQLNSLDARMKNVEESLEPLLTGYRIMQSEIRDLNKRVDKLEHKARAA